MAKKSSIENNQKRLKMSLHYSKKRAALKKIASTRDPSDAAFAERLRVMTLLSKLPRNSSAVRYRNRCKITGRARGYYRQFGVSRIALRELVADGNLPGLTKSSW